MLFLCDLTRLSVVRRGSGVCQLRVLLRDCCAALVRGVCVALLFQMRRHTHTHTHTHAHTHTRTHTHTHAHTRRNTSFIAISTLTSEMNFYTKLISKIDPLTSLPVFKSCQIQLACQQCLDNEKVSWGYYFPGNSGGGLRVKRLTDAHRAGL